MYIIFSLSYNIKKTEKNMCTAILTDRYVGRNLDVEKEYGEEIVITPRSFTLSFRKCDNIAEHHAMIGIGTVVMGYPLYFEAVNERGLYIAGLNYVGNAKYHSAKEGMINITPYELIPYLLSKCQNISQVKAELLKINLIDIPFSRELPNAELHFFIADRSGSIVAEPDEGGLSIYDNPIGVLTNNPSFPIQVHNLYKYATLSNEPLSKRTSGKLPLIEYSRGMGAIGLPGDLSSESRFARAVFHRQYSIKSDTPCEIFHLLSSVAMPRGSIKFGEEYEHTAYSSAADLERIIYYYKTYDSAAICTIEPSIDDMTSSTLIRYPIISCNPYKQKNTPPR